MKGVIKEEHLFRDQLLQIMIDNEGSDMYVTVGKVPVIKIGGDMVDVDREEGHLKWKDTMEFAQSIITEEQHDSLVKTRNLDFSFSFSDRRFRCNISFQLNNYMIVFRLLSQKIPSIEDLHLPDIYKEVTKRGQGLILVTGPTGSGKTSTLSAMIDYVNTNYKKHIITIEEPIEYVHPHKQSIMEHKEIGKDVPNYETALAGAMRQNPQIIFFGEMRTKDEMEMALRLSETGHLVMSTLHTRSAHQTITRILDSFNGADKNQIRMQLADSLIAVFSQRLLRSEDGTGVKMVKEVLVRNAAIANLIRENDLAQIPSVMQTSSREHMQLLENDIIELINMGTISKEEGLKYANNPKYILENLDD